MDKGRESTLKLSNEAFRVGEQAAQSLLLAAKAGGGNIADGIYCLTSMAAGLMTILAISVGKIETKDFEEFEPTDSITPETLLYSALLVNKTTPDYDHKEKSVVSELNPIVFFDAIEAYEKLTGKSPDEFLQPGLVKAAREAGSMGRDVLDAFMDRRKNAPEAPTSLN